MFCLIFNFQVNYEKLLCFVEVAASDEPRRSRSMVGSRPREAQGGDRRSARCVRPAWEHVVPRLLSRQGSQGPLLPQARPVQGAAHQLLAYADSFPSVLYTGWHRKLFATIANVS